MTQSPEHPLISRKVDVLGVPRWVARTLGVDDRCPGAVSEPESIVVSEDGDWSLAQATISDADELDHAELRDATREAYRATLQRLAGSEAPHPVRAWNAVPLITRSDETGQHRYMAFNAGRHDAYATHFASHGDLAEVIPTASAVGHNGKQLVIQVLGHRQPGRGIENPRQVPAFRYSSRYGKTPPSFVRATVLPLQSAGAKQRCVLVAGTASVVGEASQHGGDLKKQLDETYRNMATLVATAGRSVTSPAMDDTALQAWLHCFSSARVYVRRPSDMQHVMRSVSETLTRIEEVEFLCAEICRPELLVEIEGVATIPNPEVMP